MVYADGEDDGNSLKYHRREQQCSVFIRTSQGQAPQGVAMFCLGLRIRKQPTKTVRIALIQRNPGGAALLLIAGVHWPWLVSLLNTQPMAVVDYTVVLQYQNTLDR